ncbi:MAG: hypothetical protein HXY35_10990 [Chloroflexi bacterium]|nr:hypothetical protein [Chloroflexota bacterium]
MTSDAIRQTGSGTIPYRPSFLDRFMDSVERLPVPYWLTYLGLFLVEVALLHILAWVDGWIPFYTFKPIILVFPIWLWVPMTIMTYLDSVSLKALSIFNSLLDIDEEELKRLKYEFTTMPNRGVILSGVFWGINYLILTYLGYETFYVSYGLGSLLSAAVFFTGLVSYLTGSAIYYHSFRQLSLVNRTVKMVRQFNLFRLDPVYAFSRVTSLIGVSWMLMLTLTLLTLPIQLATGLGLAIMAVQVVLAIAAFVLPLWFVHRRLVSEKRRLIAELDQRVESTLERLHHGLDKNELEDVDHFSNAMMGMGAEREVLVNIPTWPWRSDTLAGFLSAVVLPIVLYLIQLLIEKLMSG